MKLKIRFIFVMVILSYSISKSQNLSVTGKIVDILTLKPIQSATVKSGNFGTSSVQDGTFRLILQKETLLKNGLTITCLGYENQQIGYEAKNDFLIKLAPANLTLNEVIIGKPAIDILKAAIGKIDVNYPQKDFTMNGYIKMHQIASNDTADYKYFRNEAILKVGVTPYKKNAAASKVKLIQNRNLLKDSLKKEEEYVRFVQGYLLPVRGDYVHHRGFILNNTQLKKYDYYLSSKTTINGRRTYVITFSSVKKRDNEGIIYIDSASYAIVKINSTAYNFKPLNSITISEASRTINYQKIRDKWYLQNILSNSKADYNDITYNRFEEYHTTSIDTNKLNVNYVDVIQERTEDLQINNSVAKEQWKDYEPFIDSLTQNNLVSAIQPPVVLPNYVTEKQSIRSKYLNGLRTYIINGGIRSTYKINQSSLLVNGYQPLIDKNLSSISNYNFSIGVLLRLYKNLFAESAGSYNWGIGGLRLEQNDYLLTYNFVFNKKHHPLTISPSFGYSNIALGKKKAQYYFQESLLYKMSFTYEQKRRLSYIFSTTYTDPFYLRNAGIILSNVKFVPSFGVIRRF